MRKEAASFMRWKRIREMDLDRGLKEMNGPDAKFRVIEKKELKVIAARTRRVGDGNKQR